MATRTTSGQLLVLVCVRCWGFGQPSHSIGVRTSLGIGPPSHFVLVPSVCVNLRLKTCLIRLQEASSPAAQARIWLFWRASSTHRAIQPPPKAPQPFGSERKPRPSPSKPHLSAILSEVFERRLASQNLDPQVLCGVWLLISAVAELISKPTLPQWCACPDLGAQWPRRRRDRRRPPLPFPPLRQLVKK